MMPLKSVSQATFVDRPPAGEVQDALNLPHRSRTCQTQLCYRRAYSGSHQVIARSTAPVSKISHHLDVFEDIIDEVVEAEQTPTQRVKSTQERHQRTDQSERSLHSTLHVLFLADEALAAAGKLRLACVLSSTALARQTDFVCSRVLRWVHLQ